MTPVLVIADDITGANASAAGLAQSGLAAITVQLQATAEQIEIIRGSFDVVACNTASRYMASDQAAAAVTSVLRRWWPARLVNKRVDSTLRGNIAAEVAACLSEVTLLSHNRALGVVCTAHPAAGRTTIDGHQRLHGVPLDQASSGTASIDELRASKVLDIVGSDNGLNGVEVHLATVRAGAEVCIAALQTAIRDQADFVAFDAESYADIDTVAYSVQRALAQAPDITFVTVDPGPLTQALAATLAIKASYDGPVVAILGSATDLTRRQLARLTGQRPTTVVSLADSDGLRLRHQGDVVRELRRAAVHSTAQTTLVLTSITSDGAISPPLRDAIPDAMGRVARAYLESTPAAGLFATGGDVAAAVIARLGGIGIRVAAEVAPLVVRGTIVGGTWSGLPIGTKGGLVGDENALVDCLDQLRRSCDATGTTTR